MSDKIYAVMYSYYSDWTIYGYFTNREDADKYCALHKNQNLYVEEIECYDNIDEDFRNISLKYEIPFIFRKKKNNYDNCQQQGYSAYQAEFLRSNKLESYYSDWIRVYVNVTEYNPDKAQKIATDLLYQYLDFCNLNPSEKSMKQFNSILSKEEDDRKAAEKEAKIREKELKQLEKLKAKYESEPQKIINCVENGILPQLPDCSKDKVFGLEKMNP